MKKVILTFFLIFFSSLVCALERKDANTLKDLGYPWESFYIHNYGGSNTHWYSIEEHLDLSPKFLALVIQDLEVKDQKTTYKYIYNSRHNFFRMLSTTQEGKGFISLPNFFSKNTLKAEEISDKDIDVNEFIEKILDHCKFTQLRNLKDKNNSDISISNQKDCRVIFVNEIEFKDLTFEQFEKNKDFKSYLANKDNSNKFIITKKATIKEVKKDQTSIKETPKTNVDTKNIKEVLNLAINWNNYSSLIVASVRMDKSNTSGLIEINLPDGTGKCIGSLAINPKTYAGTWSINCDDSESRSFKFKKEMNASGNINKNEQNFLIGEGKDRLGNKIVFQSEKL